MATTSVPVSLANDRGASGRALRAGPLGLIRVLSVRCEHPQPRIHASADVQTVNIGEGTQIWQHVVVLPDARIGRNCNINAMVFIENDVRVGDNVTVKSGVQLWDGVTLEDDVFVGPNATFTNDRYPRSKQYPERFERTLVKCGATIGGNATILCGLTIGRNAMIGAGSVVTHDVPDGELWVGNPARSCGQAHRLPGTAASDRAAT
jgi:UDP-2-acetamido-3-amino-2,3-dideoxy-glucuronate N-acetyltransferase